MINDIYGINCIIPNFNNPHTETTNKISILYKLNKNINMIHHFRKPIILY